MTPTRPAPSPRATGWRPLVWQLLAVSALLALVAWVVVNTRTNLAAKGVASGFDFLFQPAGFGIGEGVFPYVVGDSYWAAFVAGLGNTLRVAGLGILGASLLGALVGAGRASRHPLLRRLGTVYVELFRNVPLLLQLLACYALLTHFLPGIAETREWAGCLYLNKGGLSFPVPVFTQGVWQLDWPVRHPHTIAGGGRLTPEFLALLAGLVLYFSAYLAETLRAGLEAVPKGQREAATALGLGHGQTLCRVVLPQALPVIIPPAANQFSSLIKASSLAIVVGYPDVVSIANTSLNQSGRAVECIALILATFLVLSLAMAAVMNGLNRRAGRWAR